MHLCARCVAGFVPMASFLVSRLLTSFFFFNDPAPTEIYTLSLHDALPICEPPRISSTTFKRSSRLTPCWRRMRRSEEHTSELQSLRHLVCRLLLEKKKQKVG